MISRSSVSSTETASAALHPVIRSQWPRGERCQLGPGPLPTRRSWSGSNGQDTRNLFPRRSTTRNCHSMVSAADGSDSAKLQPSRSDVSTTSAANRPAALLARTDAGGGWVGSSIRSRPRTASGSATSSTARISSGRTSTQKPNSASNRATSRTGSSTPLSSRDGSRRPTPPGTTTCTGPDLSTSCARTTSHSCQRPGRSSMVAVSTVIVKPPVARSAWLNRAHWLASGRSTCCTRQSTRSPVSMRISRASSAGTIPVRSSPPMPAQPSMVSRCPVQFIRRMPALNAVWPAPSSNSSGGNPSESGNDAGRARILPSTTWV